MTSMQFNPFHCERSEAILPKFLPSRAFLQKYSILDDLTVHVYGCINQIMCLLSYFAGCIVPRGNQSYFLKYPDKIEPLAAPTRFSSSS